MSINKYFQFIIIFVGYITMSNGIFINLGILVTGIFIGQEYKESIPNIKKTSIKLYQYFKNTDLYKELNIDDKKKK